MQRHKKITLYLAKHPRATAQDLSKKFGLRHSEALAFLKSDTPVETTPSWWQALATLGHSLIATRRRTLLTLFALGLLVRLIYGWFILTEPLLRTPIHDAAYYIEWAKNIINHGWLGDRIFFTEPFYAYLLALFLTLSNNWGETLLIFTQFLLGATLALLLYSLTEKLINREAALWTGFLTALYGPFVFYEGLLLKTSLEVFLLPLVLIVFFRAFEKNNICTFFLAGLALGLLILVKGNNLIFWPTLIALIWYFGRQESWNQRLSLTSALSLGIILILTPVAVRNYVVGHDIVPTNYSFGLVIYQGSWWGANGSTAQVPPFLRPDPRYEESDAVGMAEAYVGHSLTPSEVSRFWIRKALQESLADPLHFLKTLGNKLLIIFNYSEFSDNYQIGFYRSLAPVLWVLPSFWVIAPFAVLGLWCISQSNFLGIIRPNQSTDARRTLRQHHILLLALFGSAIMVLLATTVNARYRLPLLPFLLILAGGSITYLATLWRERTLHLVLPSIIMLATVIILILPLPVLRHQVDANMYHALGFNALERADYESARILFQKTIDLDPEYAWAYGNLMLAELALNNYTAAESSLKKLITLRSDDLSNYERLLLLRRLKNTTLSDKRTAVQNFLSRENKPDYDADFNESTWHRYHNQEDRVKTSLLRSLDRHPDSAASLIALATLEKKNNNLVQAKQYLTRVIASHPEIFPARYNLANTYIEEKNFAAVVEQLKPIYEFTPELGDTWYNYAVALIKINNVNEAIPVIKAYIERYQNDVTKKDRVEKFRAVIKESDTPNLSRLTKPAPQP